MSAAACAVIYRNYKDRIETEFTEGVDLFNHQKYQDALEKFEDIVGIDPEHAQASYYFKLTTGILEQRRNNFYNQGDWQTKRNMLVEAVISFRGAEEANGGREFRDTRTRLNSLLNQAKVQDEIHRCNDAGIDLYKKKDLPGARNLFNRVLTIDPENSTGIGYRSTVSRELAALAEAPYQEGVALYNNGRFDAAIVKFQRSLLLNPSNKAAEKDLEKARLGLRNEAFYKYGLSAFQAGNVVLALENFSNITGIHRDTQVLRQKCLDRIRDSTDSFFMQAVSFYESQKLQESLLVFKWILVAQPYHEEARKYQELTRKKLETLQKIREE